MAISRPGASARRLGIPHGYGGVKPAQRASAHIDFTLSRVLLCLDYLAAALNIRWTANEVLHVDVGNRAAAGLRAIDMTDCTFCRIVNGELPASFVYRDERCAAFMDIQPVNPGHVLVIPVRHAAYLADIDAEATGDLMRVAHGVAAALRASDLRCEGVNLFLADGEAAMQAIFHVHLHVFPRFHGDGFGLKFSPEYYTRRPPRAELDDCAAKLARGMAARP